MLTVTLFLLAAFTTQIKSEFYADRSGDIVFSEATHASVQTSWPVQSVEVMDVQVYNMLARILGAPRVQMTDVPDSPVIDIFAKPKNTLIFSLEGIDSADLPENLNVFGKTKSSSISESSSTATPYSVIASALSGEPTKTHGVVNKGWPSLKINEDNFYTSQNLYDRIHQCSKNNKGLVTIGASWSPLGVKLVSPHQHSSSQSFFWNGKTSQFQHLFEDSPKIPRLAFGIKEFPSLLQQLGKEISGISLEFSSSDSSLAFTLANHKVVTFDLSSKIDEAFVAEMLFVFNAGKYFTEDHDHLRTFSFNFESPLMIVQKYGANSEQYKLVIQLIDFVIDKIIHTKNSENNHVFDHHVIFYLPASHSVAVAKIVDSVKTQLAVVSDFIIHELPHIYFNIYSDKYNHLQMTSVCKNLRSVLSDEASKKVICRSEFSVPQQTQNITQKRQIWDAEENPNVTSDVASFHIVLWACIFIFILLCCVIYCLMGVSGEAQKTTEIYWETRTILEKVSRSTRKKN